MAKVLVKSNANKIFNQLLGSLDEYDDYIFDVDNKAEAAEHLHRRLDALTGAYTLVQCLKLFDVEELIDAEINRLDNHLIKVKNNKNVTDTETKDQTDEAKDQTEIQEREYMITLNVLTDYAITILDNVCEGIKDKKQVALKTKLLVVRDMISRIQEMVIDS